MLTRDELLDGFDNDDIRAVMIECEIPFDEALELFDLLDAGGEHELPVDDFLGACSRIRGEAKSKDLYAIRLGIQSIHGKVVLVTTVGCSYYVLCWSWFSTRLVLCTLVSYIHVDTSSR